MARADLTPNVYKKVADLRAQAVTPPDEVFYEMGTRVSSHIFSRRKEVTRSGIDVRAEYSPCGARQKPPAQPTWLTPLVPVCRSVDLRIPQRSITDLLRQTHGPSEGAKG
ncbi:hypothetical protein NDU88_011174 [Pleurodeles waltl]|uniref:Uncharacterized protein n=1 Tax=Pleurodeles waltl TaxID=8319 RepID=A0AAV7Q2C7_PLEWA|nr:hypothetical protein NDU88_011174 [Pleurodeles waltl]